MEKSKLILILIIAIFNNFTFASIPLKWDAIQGEVLIFSDNSSLIERDALFKCPGTAYLYCTVPCGVICDGAHCCPTGYHCCESTCCGVGTLCTDNGLCALPLTSTPTISISLLPVATPIPTPSPEDRVALTGSFLQLLDKFETSTYRKDALNADGETFIYEYDFTTEIMTQKQLKNIGDDSKFQADHVFEKQILPRFLQNSGDDGRIICEHILGSETLTNRLIGTINNINNLRMVTSKINGGKGAIFAFKESIYRNGVKDYLSFPDVYKAYSNTRDEVIKFLDDVLNKMRLRKRANEDININYIMTSFDTYSRSLYEDLTNMTLPNTLPSIIKSESSTLSFPYLPAILSITLGLMFLFFDSTGIQFLSRKK